MTFKELGLVDEILQAIEKEGYETPTEIQEQAIPHILKGKDLLGCAQTGTGKTAAFALPLIQYLVKQDKTTTKKEIKVLILTPTRELAIQIRDNFRKYSVNTNLKCSVIFGGVNQKSQVELLRNGIDILVATPGRLLDLINQKHVKLNSLNTLILDEADVMLDMGFIHDVKKIITHVPEKRQTLLFSATMPAEINSLAETLLKDHVTVKVHSESLTVDKIKQSLYYVDKNNKTKLLIDILKKEDIKSALIFSRTKHGANKLSDTLKKEGLNSDVIHGNKSQSARVAALENFKTGKSKILVATDIAARGIDISELSHVINYEMPEQAETYVHRIGRTGRAGFDGTAISLCNIDEKSKVLDVQRLIKQNILEIDKHDYPMQNFTLTPKTSKNMGNKQRSKPFNKISKPSPNSFGGNKKNTAFGGTTNNFKSSNARRNQSFGKPISKRQGDR